MAKPPQPVRIDRKMEELGDICASQHYSSAMCRDRLLRLYLWGHGTRRTGRMCLRMRGGQSLLGPRHLVGARNPPRRNEKPNA